MLGLLLKRSDVYKWEASEPVNELNVKSEINRKPPCSLQADLVSAFVLF